MASKIKRTKKPRRQKKQRDASAVHKANHDSQRERETANRESLMMKPWDRAKDKRFISLDRVKKRAAWLKKMRVA